MASSTSTSTGETPEHEHQQKQREKWSLIVKVALSKLSIFIVHVTLRERGQAPVVQSTRGDVPGISLSAGANVNWSTLFDDGTISITPLDVDLSISTSKSGSGPLGSTLTDSDSATAARIPLGAALGPVDIATVGASAQVSGTTSVKYGSTIDALLRFEHQDDPTINGSQAVSINGNHEFLFDLTEPGLYDFSLSGFSLDGTWTSSKIPGVNLDVTVLNKVRAERFIGIPGSSQSSTRNFELTSAQTLGFTLEVLSTSVVPEPNSVALLAATAITGLCARRKRA